MSDLNTLLDRLSALPYQLYDAAVYHNGETASRQFRPCNNANNSYSVAKAFIMTAAGMLYDEGKLDPSQKVIDILRPFFPEHYDSAWEQVTIDHVLTHRIGFREGFLDIDCEDASLYPTDDYLSIVLSHELPLTPGSTFVYSDAAIYLLSRIVSVLADEKADDFLMNRLFRPMKFREAAWSRCPFGYPIGATGLYITAKDMLKLPMLYLCRGVYGGKRYLSEEWCNLAVQREYVFYAVDDGLFIDKGGMYGQLIRFAPEHDFAFALHAHEETDMDELYAVIREYVLNS